MNSLKKKEYFHSPSIRIDQEYVYFLGDWIASEGKKIETALNLATPVPPHFIVDFSQVKNIDMSGARMIALYLKRMEKQHTFRIEKISKGFANLIQSAYDVPLPPSEPPQEKISLMGLLENVGLKFFSLGKNIVSLLSFLGQCIVGILRVFYSPHRFPLNEFFLFLQRTGLEAIPIVGLLSFLIGIVLAYQGVNQLERFGADIFTVDLLAVAIFRELGVLMTSIIVAGRSGSGFTAQIGYMKLNQELDAMKVLGINPIERLAVPRILALLVALPLLTFYGSIMGILGGALMCHHLMDLSMTQFLHQLKLAMKPWTFGTGMFKAPFFALIIGVVGCYEGFRVSLSADSIGQKTTQSVVKSIFLVIVLNAIFSILFSYGGI
jgi:phospholipid/cholesterol/gamma-HCH transport system permease protein